jgi:hypothetical protein
LRQRVAVLGGILQRVNRLGFIAFLKPVRAGAEGAAAMTLSVLLPSKAIAGAAIRAAAITTAPKKASTVRITLGSRAFGLFLLSIVASILVFGPPGPILAAK